MSDRTPITDYDLIAEKITVDELGKALGVQEAGFSWRCPLKEQHEKGDGKAHLNIFRRDGRTSARCEGCGLDGSPVELYAAVYHCTEQEAAHRLAQIAGSHPSPPEPSTAFAGHRISFPIDQGGWPKDSFGDLIAPRHLSRVSQLRWEAITCLYVYDYAELLLLQMVFECFDQYREAQDWEERIRRANEFRRLYRQLVPEEDVDWYLENPDVTEWDGEEEEWSSNS